MLEAGFTSHEICNATRDAAVIRKGRFDTLNQLRARLQAMMANEDLTEYGLPMASHSLDRRQQQQPSPQHSNEHNYLRATPSPISPKRKRDHRLRDSPPPPCIVQYDHAATKRLRSPIQTVNSSPRPYEQPYYHLNPHYRYHPCAPSSYLHASQRMMDRLNIRPMMPPQRILSPPKLSCPTNMGAVARPL
jgi:hypothetical protein